MELSFTDILESKVSRQEKAKMIGDQIRAVKGYSWVGLYDVMENEIRIISCAGRAEPLIPSFPKDKGLNGRAVSKGRSVVVNDTDKDEDYLLTFRDTKSEIVVPVHDGRRRIVGTIDVESETRNAFGEDDVRFLEECAGKVSGLWK